MEWNGMEWNGKEWNGMQCNGMAWDGMVWNGMEQCAWNGMEWNGMEWNGMEAVVQNRFLILQNRSPGPFKIRPGGSQNRGWGRPGEPRHTREAPETSQETPQSAQEAPKKRLRAPKRRPRDSQENLVDAQTPPGTRPGRIQERSGSTLQIHPRKSGLRSLCERVSNVFFR